MVCCGREGNAVWFTLCSLLTCFHLVTAGRYVTQNTTDMTRYLLNDLGIQITRKGHLVFDLMACEDAFIHLEETQQSKTYYQIVLGASGNEWFGLRNRSENAYPSEMTWGAFLNCSRYVTFWLTWDDRGEVKLGEGSDLGESVILSFNDGPAGFEIHYLSISSYYDQTASWMLLIDDSPVFTAPEPNGNTTISVPENTPLGDTIFTLVALDPENDVISFDVIGEHSAVFICVGNELKTNAALDFETIKLYRIYIRANDSRNLVDVSLNIKVTDEIDETPRIMLSQVTSVQEEMSPGALVGPFFKATDADILDTLTYSLLGADKDYFSINSSTGEMFMKTMLDRDGGAGKTDLHLDLTVTDSAGLSSSVKVTLTVVDINDNTPQFSQSIYNMNITENSPADTLLGELTCADSDSGDNSNISLSIVHGDDAGSPKFSIRGLDLFADGVSLDYESLSAYTLTVLAVDNPGGDWRNTGTAIVLIKILPENEYSPVWVTPVTNSTGEFPSHVIPENTTIGSQIMTFLADDQDGGEDGIVEYELTSVVTADGQDASNVFRLDSSSGHLTTAYPLERDLSLGGVEYYDIVVKATDMSSTPKSDDGKLRVFLSNVNDNAPRFNQSVYHFQIGCNLDLENQNFDLKVIDDDGDDLFSFCIESNIYMSVNSSTGMLSVLTRPSGSVSLFVLLTINVTDGGSPELTGECYVLVEFIPCVYNSSSTLDTTTNTATSAATEQQNASASTFDADVERWALRSACAILTAILIVIGFVYAIKAKWFSKLATETSVSSQRLNQGGYVNRGPRPMRRPQQYKGPRLDRAPHHNRVSPEPPSVSPTMSSASGMSSPSWSSADSVSEGSTQMTSLPSIESLHLV